MIKSKYKWDILQEVTPNKSDLLSVIYKNMNITDIEKHIHAGIEDLYDYWLINDMQKSVDKIKEVILNNGKIIIYGDYDCDGVTSITVLYKALKMLGANVDYDLPNRFTDGYGLNLSNAQKIIDIGYDLVISVDNGITCFEEAALLKENGVCFIITDHHELKEELPDAYAIVHTELNDYPFKPLAGVGVSFKLACALHDRVLLELIDFVMIGTIADVMPIVDENKAIVNLGLLQIKKTENEGLKRLIQHLMLNDINQTTIGFIIGPRINSCGRMDTALIACDLFTSDNQKVIVSSLETMEELNTKRKQLTSDTEKRCEELIQHEDQIIFVYDDSFHEGVLGIVASRLVDKYSKVSFVMYEEDGICKGSARSYGDINVVELLTQNSHLLERFGGHNAAAGLQIKVNHIEEFIANLNNELKDLTIQPTLPVQCELLFRDVDVVLIEQLSKHSLEQSKFLFEELTIQSRHLLKDAHTKLRLKSNNIVIDAISFNNPYLYYQTSDNDLINVVGSLSINEWNKMKKAQIMIKDYSVPSFQLLDYRHLKTYQNALPYLAEDTFVIKKPPLSLTSLKENYLKKNSGTVCVGITKEFQDNLTIITDELFRSIYKIIKKEREINQLLLADITNLDKFVLDTILKVFLELKFVIIDKDIVKIIDNPMRVPLSESKTYQNLLSKMEVDKFLYYSNKEELVDYFNKITEEI